MRYLRICCFVVSVAFLVSLSSCNSVSHSSPRQERLLTDWQFSRDSVEWQEVTVPHDWAIYGPFDRCNDLQVVAVAQNGETQVTEHTGRAGGLPYVGKGYYRTVFDVDGFESRTSLVTLLFDGAMSQAKVKLNGKVATEWPYGYNSFYVDVTELLNSDGKDNVLEVSLENLPQSSRWYPGAGLYRNVHLIRTERTHIPVWGTYITTPEVTKEKATVSLQAEIANPEDNMVLVTDIIDPVGKKVASSSDTTDSSILATQIIIENPELWSPETPSLYTAHTQIYVGKRLADEYDTRFGIRSIDLIPDMGFYLNGQHRKFKGVCNHHDLGPLGSAVNRSAIRHQLTMLKDMGCDAIRTTHNMPAPELVELCDEMGFMLIVEAFDEWDIEKCENGYHLFFDQWAEKDMVNMLRHYRNNPSVVMWSIGNEVPTQCAPEGYKVAEFLQGICHREDPTRFVTCGMDQADCVVRNGFAQLLDVVGYNYRTHKYEEAFEILPQKLLLGSETASTVSSRGVYKLPADLKYGAKYPDQQSSAYDVEYCWWSNVPDVDFALQDDLPWTIGQFVWTGFDYLGEPTPYDIDAWPSHSSCFGIIDLASIPKDRYWLYRSQWNVNEPTLHLLPHWNWTEGEKVTVMCYTSWPCAELFVNGISQGVAKFDASQLLTRYRLIWPEVEYVPGTLEVVAYDNTGREVAREQVKTAGEPDHIEFVVDRSTICADGSDLAYVTVRIVDKDGNLCPNAGNLVEFNVEGYGALRAVANGDPTCLELFQDSQMHAFCGQLTAIVQSSKNRGPITLNAASYGLIPSSIKINTK